jgi:hypothetical protein
VSFLGWRQWAVDAGGMLRPAWTPWSPYPNELLLWRSDGPTQALCLRAPENRSPSERRPAKGAADHARVPELSCVCGLYAWRTPEQLAAAPRPRWTSLPVVAGVVRLGGRVVVADRGYRAELAYPVAIHDPKGVVSAVYAVARYRSWDAVVGEWSRTNS